MAWNSTSPQIGAELRYKLLVQLRRPAADRPGHHAGLATASANAAPMSFFNVFAQTPPLLILGLQDRPRRAPRTPPATSCDTGELVVNLVDAPLARQMVDCAVDHPPEIDETEVAGLTLLPSTAVRPGRIAEAPVAFECRLERTVDYPGRCILFAEVVHMHVRDACIDPARCASSRSNTARSRGCTATGTSRPRTGTS